MSFAWNSISSTVSGTNIMPTPKPCSSAAQNTSFVVSFQTSSPNVRVTMSGVRYDGAPMSTIVTAKMVMSHFTGPCPRTYRTPAARSPNAAWLAARASALDTATPVLGKRLSVPRPVWFGKYRPPEL